MFLVDSEIAWHCDSASTMVRMNASCAEVSDAKGSIRDQINKMEQCPGMVPSHQSRCYPAKNK